LICTWYASWRNQPNPIYLLGRQTPAG